MHKKSLEAAEHFKNEDSINANRDSGESQLTCVDDMDGTPIDLVAKFNSHSHPNSELQQTMPGGATQCKEKIRSNSIASLRAKAQEHCLRLMEDSSGKGGNERRSQVLRDPNKPEDDGSD